MKKLNVKKVMVGMISALTIVSFFPVTAYIGNVFCTNVNVFADSVTESGWLTQDIFYEMDLKTSTIEFKGTGNSVISSKVCSPSAGRLVDQYEIKNVIIGEGISAIGNEAFKWCRWLNSVEILEATTVGTKAFLNCPSLQTIKMDTVTDVLSNAFESCITLENVSAKNLKTIGNAAFLDCAKLLSVEFPNVVSLASGAFGRCSSLEFVNLPNVVYTDGMVFDTCTALKEAVLPKAERVCPGLFLRCKSLEKVELYSAIDFGKTAFLQCANLKDIYLGKYNPDLVVNEDLFLFCSDEGITIHVPYGDKEKYEEAFKNNTYGIELLFVEDVEI